MASSFCIASQALCRVLAQFPDVNASLQSDCRAIIRHRDHNIGVAMATQTGLVVRPSIAASSVIGAQHWGCRSCTHRPCGKMPSNQPFIARLITQACHCSAHGLQYYFLCSITRVFLYMLREHLHVAERYGLISGTFMQVPVIQQAGLLRSSDIALRLQELQLMAEEGHLHQEHLEGMTFTNCEVHGFKIRLVLTCQSRFVLMKSPCQVEAGQLTSCAERRRFLRAHWTVQGGHSQCPILAALGAPTQTPW